MPAIHYLIMAHDEPEMVGNLVEALASDRTYLHIDAKRELKPFQDSVTGATFIEDRVKINWGGWSSIEAQLKLMKRARPHMAPGDYAILLSGDSYPLVSKHYIESYFAENSGREFIELVKMPAPEFGKPLYRILMFYIEFNAKGNGLVIKFLNFFNRLLRKLTPRDWQRAFADLQPYGGGAWWALTTEAVDYLISETARRREFVKFCKHTHIPDEHFFQTLLANSPFAESVKPSILYAEFAPGSTFASVLGREQIARFRSEGVHQIGEYGPTTYLFARKVRSEEIRESIKQELWNRQP